MEISSFRTTVVYLFSENYLFNVIHDSIAGKTIMKQAKIPITWFTLNASQDEKLSRDDDNCESIGPSHRRKRSLFTFTVCDYSIEGIHQENFRLHFDGADNV